MVNQYPISFNTSLSFSHCDLRHLRVTQMMIDQENIDKRNPSSHSFKLMGLEWPTEFSVRGAPGE